MSERIPWVGELKPGHISSSAHMSRPVEATTETAFDRLLAFAHQEHVRSAGLIFSFQETIGLVGSDFFILKVGVELDNFHVEPTYLASGTREQVSEFGLRWAEEGLASGHFEWRSP